jgi:hypothetical protein
MIEELLAHTRQRETDVVSRKIEQRMTAEEYSKLDRLEAALTKARAHAHWPGVTTAARGR